MVFQPGGHFPEFESKKSSGSHRPTARCRTECIDFTPVGVTQPPDGVWVAPGRYSWRIEPTDKETILSVLEFRIRRVETSDDRKEAAGRRRVASAHLFSPQAT